MPPKITKNDVSGVVSIPPTPCKEGAGGWDVTDSIDYDKVSPEDSTACGAPVTHWSLSQHWSTPINKRDMAKVEDIEKDIKSAPPLTPPGGFGGDPNLKGGMRSAAEADLPTTTRRSTSTSGRSLDSSANLTLAP